MSSSLARRFVRCRAAVSNFTMETGEQELRASFAHVERHDLSSELLVTDPEAVVVVRAQACSTSSAATATTRILD